MSRAFNGSNPDSVIFSAGNAAPDQGPITVICLIKTSAAYGWPISGRNSGPSSVWAVGADAGKWFAWNDFSSGIAFSPGGNWCYVVMTRSTGVPRWHFQDYTAGGAWTHTDSTFNPGDGSGPIVDVSVGGATGGIKFTGSAAVMATVTGVWTDAEIEARCTNKAIDLYSASPGWMIRFNQASTATAVQDDTGGGGNQTSISGTSIDTDPPGYDYSLTSTVTKTVDLRWSISQSVTKTIDLRWSISQMVTNTVDLRWSISQPVTQTVDLRWSISQAVTNTIDLQWSLAQQVAQQLDLRWSIAAAVTHQIDIRWQVVGQVRATFNLQWAIDGPTATTPANAFIVNRRSKVFMVRR